MDEYLDVINIKYHISKKHPRMSIQKRAAQFAPFAALTGHSDAIKETARLTYKKIELDEEEKEILDEKLKIISQNIVNKPEIIIEYFVKDKLKQGGMYVTRKFTVKKINFYSGKIVTSSKDEINISDILNITGDMLNGFD